MNFLNRIFDRNENKPQRIWDRPHNILDRIADVSLFKKKVFGKNVYWYDVGFYLEQGGDATVQDEKGNTLAHVYPEVVQMLVVRGADTNLLNDEGYSPAMLAAQKKRLSVDMIKATSEENLNRIYPDGETVLTTYLSKVSYIEEKIIEALFEKGANPNQKNAEGQTPFGYVPSYQRDTMLPIFIKYGYDVNSVEIDGEPLSFLMVRETPSVLIDCENIKLDARDKDGNTLLHIWAKELSTGLYTEPVFNKLVEQIDINAQNNAGQTPLMVALEKGTFYYSYMCHGEPHYDDTTREKEIKILLAHGANVRRMDNKGNTALHYAARAGLSEIIPMLIKAGAYAWMANEDGAFPHDCAEGIAHEYLKILAGCCAGDYQFHSGFVYNPQPQKITSEQVVQPRPDNQNTIN